MVSNTNARKYGSEVTDSQIVEEIASDAGVAWIPGTTLQATPPRGGPRVKKKGTSDWDFVRKLAVANNFGNPYVRYSDEVGDDLMYFRGTNLNDQADQLLFLYDVWKASALQPTGNLLNFQPTLSLSSVPTSVRVSGWDQEQQQPIAVEVSITAQGQSTTIYRGEQVRDLPPHTNGTELLVQTLSTGGSAGRTLRPEEVSTSVVRTTSDAEEFARRWLRTRNLAFFVARAEVIGDPRVWVGQIHRFEGLADNHEGLYEVTAARHRISVSGYYILLDLTRVIEEGVFA